MTAGQSSPSVTADLAAHARAVAGWPAHEGRQAKDAALLNLADALDAALADAQMWRTQYERERVRIGYVLGWLTPESFDGDQHEQARYIGVMDTADRVKMRLRDLRNERDAAVAREQQLREALTPFVAEYIPAGHRRFEDVDDESGEPFVDCAACIEPWPCKYEVARAALSRPTPEQP